MFSYLDFYYTCTYVEDSNNVNVVVLNLRALVDYLESRGLELPGSPESSKLDPPCIHGGTPSKQQVLDYVVLSKPFDIAAKRATSFVDSFRQQFAGTKRTRTQHLEWPRIIYDSTFLIDSTYGYYRTDNEDYFGPDVPDVVVFATAYTFVRLLNNLNPFGKWFATTPTNVQNQTVGPISTSYFDAANQDNEDMTLRDFLRPLFSVSNSGGGLRAYRRL